MQMANEEFTGAWHLRETQALIKWLKSRDSHLVASSQIEQWLDRQPPGPWTDLLAEAMRNYTLETGDAETPTGHFIEWLAEWVRETRRRQTGVLLMSAHRAKGLEFSHVVILDGSWNHVDRNEDADAPRRLYYVAMTRAGQTLTLCKLLDDHPFHGPLQDLPAALHRSQTETPPPPAELQRIYRRLSLRDVDLSYAGRRSQHHHIHRTIANLSPGDPLKLQQNDQRWELLDRDGTPVGRLAGAFQQPRDSHCTTATVLAVATWNKERSEPQYRSSLKSGNWEVVVPELVFEPAS